MIQDINPHKFDLTYGQPKAQDEDFVLYIKKSKTLLRKVDEENHKIPKFSDFPEDKELLKESAYYLFAIDGNHYYYVTEMPRYDSDVYELCSTAAYRKMHPMYQAFAGITATQIHRFKESRKYCGRCGHLMENSKTERALVCPECGTDGVSEDLSGCHRCNLRRGQTFNVQIPREQQPVPRIRADRRFRGDRGEL